MTQKKNKFESFVRIIVSLFAVFLMGVLSLASLFSTTGMNRIEDWQAMDSVVNRIRPGIESVWYYHDNILGNLIWLALGFFICFLIMPVIQKWSLKKEILFIMSWTVILGIIWVVSSQVAPSEDSGTVMSAAVRAAQDDFTWMEMPYFSKFYPFQMGYVLFSEILIRIHDLIEPTQTLMYLEVLNVFLLAGIYAGLLVLMDLLFADKKIRALTGIFMLFNTQAIIFCAFLYGIYPGLLFAVWAMVFEAAYFQTEKIRFIPLSALCIAIAYTIKPNYLICLIAMMIIAGVKCIGSLKNLKKMVICGAYIILSCLLPICFTKAVYARYSNISGIEIGDTMPLVSYIVMGMNEAENAPGWYTYWPTLTNFEVHNFKNKESAEASVEEIKKRLEIFSQDPIYRNEFFYRKFLSQWNETSYQSIWNNQVRMQYKEKGKLAAWICGDGEKKTKFFMDCYAQLIFWGVFIGCLFCMRKKSLMQMILPLVVIGGMMYHLLSESKSQYAMPYFILMMGFSAVGICGLYDKYQPLEYLKNMIKNRGKLHEGSDEIKQISESDSAA